YIKNISIDYDIQYHVSPKININDMANIINENTIKNITITIEDIGKWIVINRIANNKCGRYLEQEILHAISCTTEEINCDQAQFTIPYIWSSNLSVFCNNEIMGFYYELYGKNPTVTQMCQMNAMYFVDVYRKEKNKYIHDDIKIDVIDELLDSFPISLLWNNKKNINESRDSIEKIIKSEDLSIHDSAVTLCAMIRPLNSKYYDYKGRNIILSTVENNDFNYELAHLFLYSNQYEYITNNETMKPRSIISKIVEIKEQKPTYTADIAYFLTSEKNKVNIEKWASSSFSWNENYHPIYMWNNINKAEDVKNILRDVIKDYNELSEINHPVFIIETVEEGIDTVKSAMIRFIYDMDLSKNHKIYFIASPDNSVEDEKTITTYLDHNSWEGVYWKSDILVKSTSKSRFFGLKQRSPEHFSITQISHSDLKSEDIPTQYDMRNENNKLNSFISYIYDQGSCGSCWAISAAEIIGTTYCKKDPNHCEYQISAQDILSCAGQGDGCAGAYMGDSLLNVERMGCVSDDCLPYINGDCGTLESNGFKCKKYYNNFYPTSTSCNTVCHNNSAKHSVRYVSDVLWLNAGYNIGMTERVIQEHILKYGPVISGFEIFDDFEHFKSFDRVYTHSYNPRSIVNGGHAVILIGWGMGNDINGNTVPYWLAKNSWGKSWGANGFFKIIRRHIGAPHVEAEVYGVHISPSV
ncbi:MAG: hypothetical protein EOP34_06755, partial [Rickettsiales bacterium]